MYLSLMYQVLLALFPLVPCCPHFLLLSSALEQLARLLALHLACHTDVGPIPTMACSPLALWPTSLLLSACLPYYLVLVCFLAEAAGPLYTDVEPLLSLIHRFQLQNLMPVLNLSFGILHITILSGISGLLEAFTPCTVQWSVLCCQCQLAL